MPNYRGPETNFNGALENEPNENYRKFRELILQISKFILTARRNHETPETAAARKALAEAVNEYGLGPADPEINWRDFNMQMVGVFRTLTYKVAPIEFLRAEPGKIFERSVGQIEIENRDVKFQIEDPENLIDTDPQYRKLLGITKNKLYEFRNVPDSPFKLKATLAPGMLVLRADPGSHKESISIAWGPDENQPAAIFYEHQASQLERTSDTPRFSYVKTLAYGPDPFAQNSESVWSNDPKNKNVSNFTAIPNLRKLPEYLEYYLDLAQSVKNLDLFLPAKDLEFAINMFKEGVINMQWFLGFANSEKNERETQTYLNTSEQLILGKYLYERQKIRETKAAIKERLERLSKAKDLNFKLLAEIRDLEYSGRQILAQAAESPKAAAELLKKYDQICDGIQEMLALVGSSSGYMFRGPAAIDLNELKNKFKPAVEQLALIAKFGYGSADLQRLSTGDIDRDPALEKLIPEKTLQTYKNFTKIFSEKNGGIKSWDEVESLNEAVRFLHMSITMAHRGLSYQIQDFKNDRFSREKRSDSGISVVDVTDKGLDSSEIYKIFYQDVVKKMGDRATEYFNFGTDRDNPVAIIGNDRAEFTFPGGKHYLEMATDTHEQPPDYKIVLRYVESGYVGAKYRQDFATEVLEEYGFKISRNREDRGILSAIFSSESKEQWRRGFEAATRLAAGLKDLDMSGIGRDALKYFKLGAVENFSEFEKLAAGIKKGSVASLDKDFIKYTLREQSEFQISVLARVLLENSKSFEKDFVPLTANLQSHQLDSLLDAIMDLADAYEAQGDKKMANKCDRFVDKLAKRNRGA